MVKKITLVLCLMFFCVIAASAQETVTITSYFPSPYGSYNELQLFPHSAAVTPCNAAARGTMFFDSDDSQLKICDGAAGNWVSKTPQVIHATDTRLGCPPVAAANTDLISSTFTLLEQANVYVSGQIIRFFTGRADLWLQVDGTTEDQTLTYTPAADGNQWADANVQWSGSLAQGVHTIRLRGSVANAFGCGGTWGSMDIVVYY